MDATDLYARMVALEADSMDELDLIDEADNLRARIWKEKLMFNDTAAYYRIRISGCDGLVCELLPDVINDTKDGLQLYTDVNGKDENMMLCGILLVSKWKVVGE